MVDGKDIFEENGMQEFIAACAKRFCPHCGKAIVQPIKGRRKTYCCDNHRWAEWKKRRYRRERERKHGKDEYTEIEAGRPESGEI